MPAFPWKNCSSTSERQPRGWTIYTAKGCCTATSSRTTSWSSNGTPRWPTSAWPACENRRKLPAATICGTPAYMAPEMWSGKVSEHTDQYCLAITYVELRRDRRVFAGGDLVSI